MVVVANGVVTSDIIAAPGSAVLCLMSGTGTAAVVVVKELFGSSYCRSAAAVNAETFSSGVIILEIGVSDAAGSLARGCGRVPITPVVVVVIDRLKIGAFTKRGIRA